jgi:hypothetical protein
MKLIWGISQEELIKSGEGLPDPEISKRDTLLYHSEVLGEKALIAYIFASNKLIRAKCMLSKYFLPDAQRLLYPSLPPKIPPLGECFRDFEKFEKAIIVKYGKPIRHHTMRFLTKLAQMYWNSLSRKMQFAWDRPPGTRNGRQNRH